MIDRFKFRIKYQSPNTDEPNEVLISEPFSLTEYIGKRNFQIDFTDGGYLMSDEIEWENVIWMQCTGLKDKNGKLIYEGDIIQPLAEASFYGDATAEYKRRVFRKFVIRIPEVYMTILPGGTIREDTIEIIGNIYENPELLTIKK
jgi:hypothetical protein